MQNFAIIFRV